MPQERMQKILARAGYGSRRACEDLILAGRVMIDGKVAELGQKADPSVDEIRLDGELVQAEERSVYIILNKPLGVLSSSKSQGGHRTVVDLVNISERVFPVGRLDLDSQGLILLTNDGQLTHQLTHPRYEHEKEYRLLLNRPPDKRQLSSWRRGVILKDGVRTLPAQVEFLGKSGETRWVRVILKQGRKRQLRETAEALGLRVVKLIRVRIGPIRLGDLKSGEWRSLSLAEERKLKASLMDASRKKHHPSRRSGKKRRPKLGKKNSIGRGRER